MNVFINGEWKEVDSIYVMPTEGGEWKEIDEGWIADGDGAIDKKFYEKAPDWIEVTGEICRIAYDQVMLTYGDKRTHTSVSAGKIIRPVTIKMDITARRGEADTNPKLRCTCYHSTDNVNWIALPYQEETISTTYSYIYGYSFAMNGNTDVKYLKFVLEHRTSGGAYIVLVSSVSKCTKWWEEV